MLKLYYNNDTRRLAMAHAKKMCKSSYELGRRFYSYKGQRDNNDETAFLGKIGEILVEQWLKVNGLNITVSPLGDTAYAVPETNFNGDFVINGRSIELKTKTINCEPRSDFDVGSTRISKSWCYLFSRIWDDQSTLFLCGWIPTDEFRAKSIFRPRGTFVKNSRESEFTCLSDEYLLKINQLREPQELIATLL